MLVMVVEVLLVALHHLVHIALQMVDRVDKLITHIREVLVEMPVVETLIYQVVVEKWHMEQTEKVEQVHHSGINLVVHTIMPITKKRSLMVNGGLEEVMDIILKMITHIITHEVVRVA